MVIDQGGLLRPTSSGILEVADHFALLGIDTDNGIASRRKGPLDLGDVPKLRIAVASLGWCAMFWRKFFVIDSQRIGQFSEQPPVRIFAELDTTSL